MEKREEKTLQELDTEVKTLNEEIKKWNEELNQLTAKKSNDIKELENELKTYEQNCDVFNNILKACENGSGPEIENQKEVARKAIDDAKKKMDDIRNEIAEKGKSDNEITEQIKGIKENIKKANDRLDLIILSVGANEEINKAIRNEIENDFDDKIDKKAEQIKVLEEKSKEINDDSEVKNKMQKLSELTDELSKATQNFVSINEVNRLLNEIRNSSKELIKNITDHLKNVKGIKHTNITWEVDKNGNLVVSVLDEKIKGLNSEKQSLENEKESMLQGMRIVAEMDQNSQDENQEYQDLKDQIEEIRKEKKEKESRIATLNAEIEDLKNNSKNIDDEEIKQKMEEFWEANKKETEAYKNAQEAVVESKKALIEEKENPSIDGEGSNYQDGDEIVENEAYLRKQDEKANLEDGLKVIYFNNNLHELNKYLTRLHNAYDKKIEETNSLKKEFDSKYITEEGYPDLLNKDSELNKAFSDYKEAEKSLREALYNLQINPEGIGIMNDESKPEAKYIEAINNFKEAEKNFLQELRESHKKDGDVEPTSQAMHDYLMRNLKDGKENDLVYDEKRVEKRIIDAENTYNVGLDKFLNSSNELADFTKKILLGREFDDDANDDLKGIIEKHIKHRSEIKEEKAISYIMGTNSDILKRRSKFVSKIVDWYNKIRKNSDYAFDDKSIKKIPKKEMRAIMDSKNDIDDLNEIIQNTEADMSDRIKSLKPSTQEKIDNLKTQIGVKNAELDSIPQKINKSAIERLNKAKTDAETYLTSIEQYELPEEKKAEYEALRNQGSVLDEDMIDKKSEELRNLEEEKDKDEESIKNLESKINVLDVVKKGIEKVKSIFISDARKLSDRRSGRNFAKNLTDAVKKDAEKRAKDSDSRE